MTVKPLISLPRLVPLWIILAVTVIGMAVLFSLSWIDLPALGVGAFIAACMASAVSIWAAGHYDVIWHRTLDTGLLARPAHRNGMAAIAIGQTLGASSLTSGIVRRMALPQMSHTTIAQVTAGTALAFSASWAVLALAAMLVAGDVMPFAAPAPWMLVTLGIGIAIMLVRIGRQKMIRTVDIVAVFGWTIVDIVAAGLALYVLLYPMIEMPMLTFLAIFTLAMGAGILSHLPGGIGAFDVVLIALIPHDNTAMMLGGILIFRLVYYVLPCLLAVLWLQACRSTVYRAHVLSDPPPFTPAAWGLAAQSGTVLSTRTGAFLTGKTPLGLVSLGDPVGARPQMLAHLATQAGTLPAYYKCSARTALMLRRQGWKAAAIAKEATLDPQVWNTAGRAKQSLRRKLRAASDSGVTVARARGPLPMTEMCGIADDWAMARGGEMGFSMGKCSPAYVRTQIVFLVRRHGALCGFVTFHNGTDEWALDLIRHDRTLPDGAMHAAITTALNAAKTAGITLFSLAAVPCPDGPIARICQRRGGLTQFKRSFDPQWKPLYFAAPHHLAFWVTGLGIAWHIHRPLARLKIALHTRLAPSQLSSAELRGNPTPNDTAVTVDELGTPDDKRTLNAA